MPQTLPPQYGGSRSFIGLATETTFGTAAASTDYLQIETESLEADPGLVPVPTIRNTRAQHSNLIAGPTHIEGKITSPLFPQQGIRLLAAALGVDTIAGVSDPYSHDLTPREAGIPSLTIEKSLGGLQSEQYISCLVSKMKMTGAVGAPVKVEYDVIGQQLVLITPTTPAWVAGDPYALGDIQIILFGSTEVYCKSFEFELDNGVQMEHTYNLQTYPSLIYSNERKITGKVGILLQTMNYLTTAVALTRGTLQINMTKTGVSPARTAAITLSKIVWGKPSVPLVMGRQIVQELPFTAFLPAGTTNDLECIMLNGYATAYV